MVIGPWEGDFMSCLGIVGLEEGFDEAPECPGFCESQRVLDGDVDTIGSSLKKLCVCLYNIER